MINWLSFCWLINIFYLSKNPEEVFLREFVDLLLS